MAKLCAWCHKQTRLPKVFAAQSPLLEWMEEKINTYCEAEGIDRSEIWGEHSDWGRTQIPESLENEIINNYNDYEVKDRSKLFNYFMENKLKSLIENINDF